MNLLFFLVALGLHLALGLWLFNFYQSPAPVLRYEAISVTTIEEQQLTDLLIQTGLAGSETGILDQEQVVALAELGANQATKLQQDWLQQQQLAQERQQQELARQAELKRQAEEREREKVRQQEEARKLTELQRKREEERKQAELQRKREEERKQAELQRKREEERKQAEAKKQAEIQAQRQAAERAAEAERQRRAAQEAATRQKIAAARQAEREQRIAQVMGQIRNKVLNHWASPIGTISGMSSIILINLAANGNILHAQIVVSSGNSMFDNAAVTAVYKASPFNIPADLLDEFSSFQFNFRPN